MKISKRAKYGAESNCVTRIKIGFSIFQTGFQGLTTLILGNRLRILDDIDTHSRTATRKLTIDETTNMKTPSQNV